MNNRTDNQRFDLYCDLDGVLVNFIKGASTLYQHVHNEEYDNSKYSDEEYANQLWKTVNDYIDAGNEFWFNLEKLPDADKLWTHIKHMDPIILTATGRRYQPAAEQKAKWVTHNINTSTKTIAVTRSVDKAQYASPNAILIDDSPRSINPWIQAGGIGILHTSAADTIQQLNKILGR